MTRLALICTGLSVGILVVVAAIAAAASGGAPSARSHATASVSIRHQTHGCHSWSVNGGPFRASQSIVLAPGGTVTFGNNDVMPHKLVLKSGPAVKFTGKPAMRHMGATVRATFSKAGTYLFVTKAGDDYTSGIKTTGDDNNLRLTVRVS
jgi:plastocyanin